jgi:hypothetical protein
MHTDSTLDILSQATMSLGESIRDFQEKTCTMFQTRELERERAARQRRQEKKTANRGARSTLATSSDTTGESTITANHGTGSAPASAADNHRGESTNSENQRNVLTPASSGSSTRAVANVTNSSSGQASKVPSNNTRKSKLLNLETYTYHAMGDYVKTIRTFGTTDSYSTQPVSI